MGGLERHIAAEWPRDLGTILRGVADPLRISEDHQNSKSTENCNCLGMAALFAVANTGVGALSEP